MFFFVCWLLGLLLGNACNSDGLFKYCVEVLARVSTYVPTRSFPCALEVSSLSQIHPTSNIYQPPTPSKPKPTKNNVSLQQPQLPSTPTPASSNHNISFPLPSSHHYPHHSLTPHLSQDNIHCHTYLHAPTIHSCVSKSLLQKNVRTSFDSIFVISQLSWGTALNVRQF